MQQIFPVVSRTFIFPLEALEISVGNKDGFVLFRFDSAAGKRHGIGPAGLFEFGLAFQKIFLFKTNLVF
jgi:hypothetical protein